MALVPDTFTFSLQDVTNVTSDSNLSDCFTYYDYGWIDGNYWYSEIGMRRFRNYGPKDYITLTPNYRSYYDSGSPKGDYDFIVDSSVDWTIDVDDSEISEIFFYPNYGSAGQTQVLCFVYSSNYNSWSAVSSNNIHNSTYSVYTYFTACQDGYNDQCN